MSLASKSWRNLQKRKKRNQNQILFFIFGGTEVGVAMRSHGVPLHESCMKEVAQLAKNKKKKSKSNSFFYFLAGLLHV
jgi:hypothetical protein